MSSAEQENFFPGLNSTQICKLCVTVGESLLKQNDIALENAKLIFTFNCLCALYQAVCGRIIEKLQYSVISWDVENHFKETWDLNLREKAFDAKINIHWFLS